MTFEMHFKVQMWPLCVTGAPDISNDVAFANIAAVTLEAVEMGVVELVAQRCREPCSVAAEAVPLEVDRAGLRGNDRCASLPGYVDPLMATASRTARPPAVDELAAVGDWTGDRARRESRHGPMDCPGALFG